MHIKSISSPTPLTPEIKLGTLATFRIQDDPTHRVHNGIVIYVPVSANTTPSMFSFTVSQYVGSGKAYDIKVLSEGSTITLEQ